jgi:hypothetical protein
MVIQAGGFPSITVLAGAVWLVAGLLPMTQVPAAAQAQLPAIYQLKG